MVNALLFFNPAARRVPGRGEGIAELSRQFEQHGIQLDTRPSRPGDSLRRGELEGRDLLVVWGGDGTIHQALEATVACGVPLALIPGGTANVLVRELGIPWDPARAVTVAARGRRRSISIGRGNGRYFHAMAGAGLDAFVVSRISRRLKRRAGVIAYWITTLAALFRYPFRPFQVRLEDETLTGTLVVLGKSRNYGGQLLVTPHASLSEDRLDVCVFTSPSRWRYVSYFFGTLSGRHLSFPDVVYRQVRKVRVEGHSSIPVQMDGEAVAHLPMEFQSVPDALTVVVP